jgi:hypothetical protein
MGCEVGSWLPIGGGDMASYAEVEAVLAQIHSVTPEVQRGAFRGRLKHLQTLGVPLEANPGKGKRIDYTREQIIQISLALELAEFGIDPKKIAKFVKDNFESINDHFIAKDALAQYRATYETDEDENISSILKESFGENIYDSILIISAEMLSEAFNRDQYEKEQLISIGPKEMIMHFRFEDYPRVMVINLSELIRRLAPLLSSKPGKE